jgi:hypothetical protein
MGKVASHSHPVTVNGKEFPMIISAREYILEELQKKNPKAKATLIGIRAAMREGRTYKGFTIQSVEPEPVEEVVIPSLPTIRRIEKAKRSIGDPLLSGIVKHGMGVIRR